DTDCVSNVTNYCDYIERDTRREGARWLENADGDLNTDCIDVGTPVQACGSVTIPLTEIVTGLAEDDVDFWIEYVEGTDIAVGTAAVAEGGVIAFPEDYNGGSVTVTVYIGGAEQDFVTFAGEGAYAYAAGGVEFTIDTDCVSNVTNYCD